MPCDARMSDCTAVLLLATGVLGVRRHEVNDVFMDKWESDAV